MKETKFFSGGNTELAESFNAHTGNTIEPKRLKQLMNLWKENLRELGLTFRELSKDKNGGSKVKRDKGGMPGEPGYRQKLRQAKAFRNFIRCYDFGNVLRTVCPSKELSGVVNTFSVLRKVLPQENGLR